MESSSGAIVIVWLGGAHVVVHDTTAALRFYRDILGLTVAGDELIDGYHRVTLYSGDHPDCKIVLSQPHAGRSNEDGDALARLLTNGSLQPLELQCEDVDATFDAIASQPATEVEILQEPITRQSGVRDIAMFDPSGNIVRVEQRVTRTRCDGF